MNINNDHSTLKNLKKKKPNYLYEYLVDFDITKNFEYKNSGGLRAKGFFKSFIPNKPIISIITVCLNSEYTIEKTIQSVLKQNYDNIEYIVIDGNSNDRTLEIIKKYEGSIDLWISEKDSGIFNAINKGITVCSGDIIGILNSDDLLTEDALSLVKKYFENDKIDFVFGSVEKERLLSGFNKEKISWKFNVYPAHSSGFFVRKKCHIKAGLYDEKFKLHADYDLIYRMTCNLKLNGIAMKRSDITGIFNIKGRSSEEGKIKYFYEEYKIRKKNKQNFFFISLLIVLKYIYFILFKIKIFAKLFKFIQKKINF